MLEAMHERRLSPVSRRVPESSRASAGVTVSETTNETSSANA